MGFAKNAKNVTSYHKKITSSCSSYKNSKVSIFVCYYEVEKKHLRGFYLSEHNISENLC